MLCNMHTNQLWTTHCESCLMTIGFEPALNKVNASDLVSLPPLIRVAISSSIPPRKTVWVQLSCSMPRNVWAQEINVMPCAHVHWLWLCALHSHLLLHNRLFLVYIICEGFQCPRAALCVYSWAWLMPSIHCLTTCSFMCRITCTQKMAYMFHPSVHPQSVLPSQLCEFSKLCTGTGNTWRRYVCYYSLAEPPCAWLASFPGLVGGDKVAWYPLCAHARLPRFLWRTWKLVLY